MGICYSLLLNEDLFEIVDFPNLKIKDDDFAVRHVCLPKGKIDGGSEP